MFNNQFKAFSLFPRSHYLLFPCIFALGSTIPPAKQAYYECQCSPPQFLYVIDDESGFIVVVKQIDFSGHGLLTKRLCVILAIRTTVCEVFSSVSIAGRILYNNCDVSLQYLKTILSPLTRYRTFLNTL